MSGFIYEAKRFALLGEVVARLEREIPNVDLSDADDDAADKLLAAGYREGYLACLNQIRRVMLEMETQ